MKVVRLSLTLAVFAFVFSLTAHAQLPREFEYWKTPNSPIVDFSTTSSSIDVPDNFTINDMQVMVDIDHEAAADLTISLTGPSGTYVLSTQNGSAGANYENTIFDSSPSGSLPGLAINDPGNVTAYFRGVYSPESVLPSSGTGTGMWTLSVTDNLIGDQGMLVRWGLIFNRYGRYRDVRWGTDLNIFGVTRLTQIAPLFIDDVTPIPPYTVNGYRPQAQQLNVVALMMLGRTPGTGNITVDTKYPGGSTASVYEQDVPFANPNVYPFGFTENMGSNVGSHEITYDVFMRGDLYQTRPDNQLEEDYDVTAGSLGYDNGAAQNTLFPLANECDGSVYFIDVPQTLTSVDVWQGSSVELEPQPSISTMAINVYDLNSGMIVATTGPVAFPEQGEKWVSYPFSPPVQLPSGVYRVAACLTAIDGGSAGPALGLDQVGSPFEPLGPYSRYENTALQQVSFDGGTNWLTEDFRLFTAVMIRPNFVQLSDVGVIAIYPVAGFNTFDVTVKFGAYAHYSYLPNQVTFGKVWITNNANGSTVGYMEKRVFLNAAPFQYSQLYSFPSLGSGSYTIHAEVVRPDDENLINNHYSRQFNVPYAPIIVSTQSGLGQDLKDAIVTSYSQLGANVEFVDRSFGFEFPADRRVLWVGDMNAEQSNAARAFVQNGGELEVLPTTQLGPRTLTSIFTSLANDKEMSAYRHMMEMPQVTGNRNIQTPAMQSLVNGNMTVIGKNKEETTSFISRYATQLIDRVNSTPSRVGYRTADENLIVSGSDKLQLQAVRMADITVARVMAKDSKPSERFVEAIVNPANFELTQNYPNPFNPTTNIAFNVPADANVSIRVYDILGREVAALVNGFHQAGQYITTWDAHNSLNEIVPSGIYLYRMEAAPVDGSAPFNSFKKMILSR